MKITSGRLDIRKSGGKLRGKAALNCKGYYTKHKANNKLDVVIVEASAITEEGGIIPGASVGASPELIQMADKVRLIAFIQQELDGLIGLDAIP